MVVLGHIKTFRVSVAKVNFGAPYFRGPELTIQINNCKNLLTKSEIQTAVLAPPEPWGPMQTHTFCSRTPCLGTL